MEPCTPISMVFCMVKKKWALFSLSFSVSDKFTCHYGAAAEIRSRKKNAIICLWIVTLHVNVVCVCAKERVLLILVFFCFSFCSEAVKPGKRSALFALFFYYHRMPFLLQITLLCCIHLLNFIASGSNNSGREKIAVSLPQKTEIINVKLFKIHWNVSAIRWWRIRFFLLVYQQ